MTRTFQLLVMAVMAFTVHAQNKSTAEVEKLFRKVDTLIAQRDSTAFEQLLTDDFTFIAINGGILDRKEVMERQKAGILMAGTPNEILSIHHYGAAAIVAYRTMTKGGTTIIGSRVFVNQAGAWKWASSQGTVQGGALPGK